MSQYEYRGSVYPPRRAMCQARRAHYVELLNQGMNFTQAARMVGVSKRTGKAWRKGRARSTDRNERPRVDWYRHDMDQPDRHDAQSVQHASIAKMRHLPKLLRNTLTPGANSPCTAQSAPAWACRSTSPDLHSPWQRGTNENTNGLMRQYFPKGTNLSIYPEKYLDAVAEELNDRPRKTLDYMKPNEKIIELINQTA